ncbi:hypothetical protein [Trinickia terrae]
MWQNVEVESFLDEALYPVASLGLAEKLKNALSAADILNYPLLHDSDVSGWRACRSPMRTCAKASSCG